MIDIFPSQVVAIQAQTKMNKLIKFRFVWSCKNLLVSGQCVFLKNKIFLTSTIPWRSYNYIFVPFSAGHFQAIHSQDKLLLFVPISLAYTALSSNFVVQKPLLTLCTFKVSISYQQVHIFDFDDIRVWRVNTKEFDNLRPLAIKQSIVLIWYISPITLLFEKFVFHR